MFLAGITIRIGEPSWLEWLEAHQTTICAYAKTGMYLCIGILAIVVAVGIGQVIDKYLKRIKKIESDKDD